MNANKTLIASAICLALMGSQEANATLVTGVLGNVSWSTSHANFTFLSAYDYDWPGATVGGTNNLTMTWDGNAYTSSADYTGPGGSSNVTLSTTSPFFSYFWTAHDIQMFVPGTYSFDTTLGGGNAESGALTATVGAGQLGMHMLFDWGGNNNIDVFMVFGLNSMFGSGVVRTTANASTCDTGGIQNCLWNSAVTGVAPPANHIWMLASVDGNGDGVMGIPMAAGGPFADFNFNVNADLTQAPVPAAVWLLGSGLMCLAGVGHRRKKPLQ